MNRTLAGGAPGTSRREPRIAWAGLIPLFAVYLIWGSTYLAIRLTVREGAGFSPFTMGAMRTAAGGGLLLLGAACAHSRPRLTKEELFVLAASGIFLWTGGNGLVIWAEQRTASGYAALFVGLTPIWVAVIEAFLDRRLPSWLLAGSLLTGFAGLGVLSLPLLAAGTKADFFSILALLLASVSWAAGSVLQNRKPPQVSPLVSSGYQHLFGGLGFAAAALLLREPLPHPTSEAWYAWGYLVVFGSIVAFTSYIQALRLLPTSIAMTYSYVNPVIAVFLGWLILHEPVTAWTMAGTALVLLGVAGVFRDRVVTGRRRARAGRNES